MLYQQTLNTVQMKQIRKGYHLYLFKILKMVKPLT